MAARFHSTSAQSNDRGRGEAPRPEHLEGRQPGDWERWAEGGSSPTHPRLDLLWRRWFPQGSSAGRCSAEPHQPSAPVSTNTLLRSLS